MRGTSRRDHIKVDVYEFRIVVFVSTENGIFGRGMRWSLYFFFSSRRRHTRFDCDWSSDVCSSDLGWLSSSPQGPAGKPSSGPEPDCPGPHDSSLFLFERHEGKQGRNSCPWRVRSEERRVGEECRSWWSPHHLKKKHNNTLLHGVET